MHMSGHYLTIASYNIVTDHLIQLDTCVYFQFIPIFGFIISVLQLLTIAIDRVLSLMSFYNPLVEKHMKLYVALQILPSCLMGAAMSIWLFVDRNSNERVLCFVPTPMMGIKYELLNRLIIIAGVLIILCYVFFIIYLRKIRLRGIYPRFHPLTKRVEAATLVIEPLSFARGGTTEKNLLSPPRQQSQETGASERFFGNRP
ncbi:hypothetical protein GCK32_013126 [Trichostrongylus colubriformis]|uniref:G-protein coupled receptors family 1 profile domain-containing protein n=1 Tax=Trichostrongylus colubriformis TaxID=6319 RepID=A0AAN8ESV5_TRICO